MSQNSAKVIIGGAQLSYRPDGSYTTITYIEVQHHAPFQQIPPAYDTSLLVPIGQGACGMGTYREAGSRQFNTLN